MSLEDFFLISKRYGSKSFILIVSHLFFFNADWFNAKFYHLYEKIIKHRFY